MDKNQLLRQKFSKVTMVFNFLLILERVLFCFFCFSTKYVGFCRGYFYKIKQGKLKTLEYSEMFNINFIN